MGKPPYPYSLDDRRTETTRLPSAEGETLEHRPARVHRSYHWRSALSRANADGYIFVSGQVGFVDAKGKEVFNLARFFMSTMKDFAFHTIYNNSARMRFGCPLNLGDLIRKKKTVAQLEH